MGNKPTNRKLPKRVLHKIISSKIPISDAQLEIWIHKNLLLFFIGTEIMKNCTQYIVFGLPRNLKKKISAARKLRLLIPFEMILFKKIRPQKLLAPRNNGTIPMTKKPLR